MFRRTFLSGVSAATGGLLFGFRGSSADGAGQQPPSGKVLEPAREIPVVAQADVVVVGGGPAGVAAAIAAARTGCSTLLIERYNHLGGLWTGGLVLPLLATHAMGPDRRRRQVLTGIGGEMAQRLAEMKMSIHEVDPVVDPEAAKYVMDVMVKEAGVRMLYHCWASGVIAKNGVIQAVLLESKSGRVAVVPKVVVDCTGDGDVFHWAGEKYETMRYHIGLVHRLGNTDRIDTSKPGFKKMKIGGATPLKSVRWVNMHGENNQDGLDLFNLSRLQQKYRLAIWKHTEKIRATPGYEEVFLLDTASQIGVRVSRILDGQYRLTLNDSMTHKAFEDTIGISGAWTSVLHGGKKVSEGERPMWQIPYRSIVPKRTQNLLVAGRCFCFEKTLVEDARVIGTCLVTGHGAGAAAAVAVQKGTSVQEADVRQIRKTLLDQKVYLG
jgi:ribulose 1,5-bisphosphate synthetase/thiazole synthase